jgi:glutaredoxin
MNRMDRMELDAINNKILMNKDMYTVLYSNWCPYSANALSLLVKKGVNVKAYKLDDITLNGNKIGRNIQPVLNLLIKHKNKTGFNARHMTRPIIFYNGKFVGGYEQLRKRL